MFKSKLSLVAAAFTVLGAGSVFAFTPAISSIPDVIIGNRTPTDSFTPGDSFTAGDTVEGQAGEPLPDSFRFDDAINIFDLVEDQPTGVSGATADNALVYFFAADNASVGGTDSTYSIQGTLIPPGGATVTPDASGTLDFLDGPALAADPVIGSIFYPFSNAAGDVTVGPADTINAAIVTLTVTNSQGNSASDEFFTYTVVNNPDSISGGIPVTSTPLDLSLWTYFDQSTSFTSFANFNIDAGRTGTMTADDGSDGSGSDLRLAITDHSTSTIGAVGPTEWSPQESLQGWQSPAGALPFVDGGTYRLRYQVKETTPAAFTTGLVEGRIRYFYGSQGNLGNGSNQLQSRIEGTRPSAAGNEHAFMFDVLDLASQANPDVNDPSINENDITLVFESIDFFTNFGGAIELESLIVDAMSRSNVESNQTLFFDVADFTTDTVVDTQDVGTPLGTGTASAAAGSMTLTAPGPQPGTSPFLVWGTTAANALSVKLSEPARQTALTPVNQPSGLIYRTEFTVDSSSNNLTTPLPPLRMIVRSRADDGVARDTHEFQVLSLTQDPDGAGAGVPSLNPVYQGVNTYGTYLHAPSGVDFDNTIGAAPNSLEYGANVSARLSLLDVFDGEGGSVTATGITINTVPENLLP